VKARQEAGGRRQEAGGRRQEENNYGIKTGFSIRLVHHWLKYL
jgi:hypothetical protein